MLDIQTMIDTMNEQQARDRGNYHLSYGELIKALRKAPADAKYDKRIKGIGSWRGSYIEVAIFTKDSGYYACKEPYDYEGDYTNSNYNKWREENVVSGDKLPKSAGELADLLESLLGKYFTGYKGGDYKIEEYKPLWLEEEDSRCTNEAIIGITDDLKLVTKKVEE